MRLFLSFSNTVCSPFSVCWWQLLPRKVLDLKLLLLYVLSVATSNAVKLNKIGKNWLKIVQRFLKNWLYCPTSSPQLFLCIFSIIKLFSHRMNLSQMDEGKDALVFFGSSRSHTFSLRCKPKVHATLQTQKCSPENFSIDNYNSGTYTECPNKFWIENLKIENWQKSVKTEVW